MPVAKVVPVEQLAYGIREVESGGVKGDRYKVVNSIGATGAYQVMKANIPSWTKEALGRSLSLQEWLNSPSSQDKVAQYFLGKSQKQYGSWESAAAVWFSGQPNPNSRASDGGNTVREYVDKVGRAMSGGGRIGGTAPATPAPGTATGTGLAGGLVEAMTGWVKGLVSIGESLMNVGQFAEFLLKLALPSTWVRIACGLLGLAFLLFGLVVLGREARGL